MGVMGIQRRVVTDGVVFRVQFHVGDGKWTFYNMEFATVDEAKLRIAQWDAADSRDIHEWTPVEKGGAPARSDK